MPENDRALDLDLGEMDGPEPPVPADVHPVQTDWEPDTDDETEADR